MQRHDDQPLPNIIAAHPGERVASVPALLTPTGLTACLRASLDARLPPVRTAALTQIGMDEAFSGGTLYRIALGYDAPAPGAASPDAPATLIAKLSPTDPQARAVMGRANLRELTFYQRGDTGPPGIAPHCYHAEMDAASDTSVLLLQDLGALQSTPFLVGCGPADAKAVVESLARLHARWWNAPALAAPKNVSFVDEFPLATLWPRYPAKIAELGWTHGLPQAFVDLGTYLATHQAPVFAGLQNTAPITRLHGDVQADNIKFSPGTVRAGAVFLDWQFTGTGRGANDLGYFLISSVAPAQRRNMERGLVAHYHAELLRRGVVGYALSQCWTDYRKAVAGKLAITIAATVLLDNATPHKKAWRLADLDRLLAFCQDHQITPQTFSADVQK